MSGATVERIMVNGTGIDVLHAGAARIYRLPDIDRIAWPAVNLFRDLAPDRLSVLAKHVPGGTIDVASKSLIISFNPYLIDMDGRVVLVDAGIGNDKERPDRPAWHRRNASFLETLRQLDYPASAVDLVVNTHLHADHVGWNTMRKGAGWIPTFPNARYLVPEPEWSHWSDLHESGPVLHGAFADSVLPLAEAGVLDVVPQSHDLAPGLRLVPASGHSPGMCMLRLESGGESVLFTSDVVHHPFQFADPELVSNFCSDPAMARATRTRLLAELVGTETIMAPYHFPSPAFGRIIQAGSDLQFAPLG